MKYPKTRYICTLPSNVQAEIWKALKREGFSYEDRIRALDGRLCDLEDTIDIRRWSECS